MGLYRNRARARAISVVTALPAVLALFAAGGAQAQSASQITPESYAPTVTRTPSGAVRIAADSGEIPAGADAIYITLSGVAIGGEITSAQRATLNAALVGRRIAVSEIFAAAAALQTELVREGSALARVRVAAQELEDGAVVRLVVVHGRIATVNVEAVPAAYRAQVAATLAPLVGRSDIMMAQIERRLLLAADLPGLTLQSTLESGDTPGAVELMVAGQYRPVSAFLAYDNLTGASLGGGSAALGLNGNNLLGAAETLYLRMSGAPQANLFDRNPRNRAVAGGVVVPLGTDGFSLNLEYTDARTTPRVPANSPIFSSHFTRFSSRASYPVVRSRALTVTASAAFDAQNDRQSIVDPIQLPLSLDRFRVIRLGGDASGWLPGDGSLSAGAQLSVGIDALGARSARDATPEKPLSRAGADAAFRKLEIDMRLRQPLVDALELGVVVHAQSSFGEALGNGEQFGLARADGLSPLPSGSLQGDSGYVARGELSFPVQQRIGSLGAAIAPYGFGAVGLAKLVQPTFFERAHTDASAFGAGVRLSGRWAADGPDMRLTVEYGRAEVDFRPAVDRFSFTFVVQI